MTLLSHNLQFSLETLCAEGCHSVRCCISQLEQGQTLSAAATLTYDERQLLLNELKTIMAVYDS